MMTMCMMNVPALMTKTQEKTLLGSGFYEQGLGGPVLKPGITLLGQHLIEKGAAPQDER